MRISTGISELDRLMGGGYLENSFNLVMGSQGAGKTLFTVNYLLHHAETREVLYISLEESWRNIVRNLPNGMKDKYEKVKKMVHYLDFSGIRPLLGKEVLDASLLAEVITTSMSVHNAKIVVLDGIAPLLPRYKNDQEMRAAIFELSQRIKRMGGTMLFTSEKNPGYSSSAEEYVADSVIHLYYDGISRRIQILKMRGSDFVYGHHGFRITEKGIFVYPNALPLEKHKILDKISFGIKGMEKIAGVLYTGDIILLTGPPGTGKTVMAYHFLNESTRNGERCLYISFKESEDRVLKKAQSFGFKVKRCGVLIEDPIRLDAYEFMWKVYRESKIASRIVIDGINDIEINEDTKRILPVLLKNLKSRGITTLITYTTSDIISSYNLGDSNVIYLADTIIDLRYTEIGAELRKVLVVIKSSGMNYEKGIIEYDIDKNGIKILGKVESMEGVISGIPRHLEMRKRVEKFFK